jgi:hypothetical protein
MTNLANILKYLIAIYINFIFKIKKETYEIKISDTIISIGLTLTKNKKLKITTGYEWVKGRLKLGEQFHHYLWRY